MKFNKNRILGLILSLLICLGSIFQTISPIVAFADGETVYIRSEEDFIEFAKNCSYDAWSRGKTFVLTVDLELDGYEFSPIPTFGGSFEGNGHTISGITILGAYSPAGIFSVVEAEGLVRNLIVSASVTPDGDKGAIGGIVGVNYGYIEGCAFIGTVIGACDVGGIAGINETCGSIVSCTSGGEVIGENRTGGIVGNNLGLISSSVNSAKVNTVSITPTVSLDQLNLSLTLDISKIPSLNTSTMTDIGGISGYNTGIILGSQNNGAVGYPHIGYNVGGIAGRSSGHISGATNTGVINGRKDVGGIVGQMEPDISYNLSEDHLKSLKLELDRLSLAVGSAISSADGAIPSLSGNLNTLLTLIGDASDSLNIITNGIYDFGNGITGEINRTSEILSEVISRLGKVTADLPEITKLIGSGLKDIESAMTYLDGFASFGKDALGNAVLALNDFSKAYAIITDGLELLDNGMSKLENAVKIDNVAEAEDALEVIAKGLSDLIYALDEVTEAIKDVCGIFEDMDWADDALSHLKRASEIIYTISKSASDMYDATVALSESIDVNWEKIKSSEDSFTDALVSFREAVSIIGENAPDTMAAIEKIAGGVKGLKNSITTSDKELATKSAIEVIEGFEALVIATDMRNEAMRELEATLEGNGGEGLDFIKSIYNAVESMAKATEMQSESVCKITSNLASFLKTVTVNYDQATDSGSIILGGAVDLADSVIAMKGSVQYLGQSFNSLIDSITDLSLAIAIKDENMMAEALVDMYNCLGEIIYATEEGASLLVEMADTLAEAKEWSDEFISSVNNLADAMCNISDALVTVQSGVDKLRENTTIDLSLMKDGLALILDGFSKMLEASEYLGNTIDHIKDATSNIYDGIGELSAFIIDMAYALSDFAEAFDLMSDMITEANSLMSYLKGIDPISIPLPSESIKTEANKLFMTISSMESTLKIINSDISGLGSDITDSLAKINDIFSGMSEDIVNAIYGVENETIIDDKITEEDIWSTTNGKVFDCTNLGKVQGDINIGGIAGLMGLEFALDPEDDLTEELSVTQKRQYRLKAIIQSSKNLGEVISKRDCAGGIVGKSNLGLIYNCEAYCTVKSEVGNYVGGIAGLTSATIMSCYAKCTLSGASYIGGIIGCGVKEDFLGDSSLVEDCYSMVMITSYKQYAGAISGANIGEYKNNLFVSSTLSGIDRVSYAGKAEPIAFEDLAKRKSLPDGFIRFTLSFVADGVVLLTQVFEYGASFDSDIFPEIPEKEGHYGYWDTTKLKSLSFDTTVIVVYKPYVTALASEDVRDGGREIFFVVGQFTEEDKLVVSKKDLPRDLELEGGLFIEDVITECWTLNIPKDKLDKNNVHFLANDGATKIYIKTSEGWQLIDSKTFGSYLTFDLTGETVEIAVVKESIRIIPIAIVGVIALAGIATLVVVLVKKNKANKDTAKEKNTENAA